MSEKKKAEPVTAEELANQLVKFWTDLIEPRFIKLETEIAEFRQEVREKFDEVDRRFDDLYKKFETLHQEYIVIGEQLKRMERHFVSKQEFQEALSDLKAKVSALQERIEDLERRLLAQ